MYSSIVVKWFLEGLIADVPIVIDHQDRSVDHVRRA
jgi:hypothetical protein